VAHPGNRNKGRGNQIQARKKKRLHIAQRGMYQTKVALSKHERRPGGENCRRREGRHFKGVKKRSRPRRVTRSIPRVEGANRLVRKGRHRTFGVKTRKGDNMSSAEQIASLMETASDRQNRPDLKVENTYQVILWTPETGTRKGQKRERVQMSNV